ncbi:hypothetical protein L2E82_17083 [Cichorium intybus]|uniref:Uncharacterized protein n=1 Tax=Cichorium intybus TaxID=13427 RepID=A0ACB9F7B2_CICIN|nr:hypothetical protein L2E82_17083 [Cichorium intybus]
MKNMITIFMALTFFTSIFKVHSLEFQVNGDKGWVIPPNNDTNIYNRWASKNRFKINDTLHFAYKKDSVLVVSKEEHEKCKSSHPIFFSNNGDTTFGMDRSGYFYFISGVSGHCERGLKMIVKVLEHENITEIANQTSTNSSEAVSLKVDSTVCSQIVIIVGLISMLTVFV